MADQVGSWGKMGQTGRWGRMVPGGIPAGRVEARGRDLTMAASGSQLHLTDLVWKREFYAFKHNQTEAKKPLDVAIGNVASLTNQS